MHEGRTSAEQRNVLGEPVDRGVEAVGYQAHDPSGEEHPSRPSTTSSRSCGRPMARRRGRVGLRGPGSGERPANEGRIAWNYEQFFTKGQTMGTGQCPTKRYNRQLRDLIMAGRATPSCTVSHELPLTEAPGGYDRFDKRVDGSTKVLLRPAVA